VILDDATKEIYYAQLVEEESSRTVMAGLREVIESKGLFCALYSDRGSHFFVTMKAGETKAVSLCPVRSRCQVRRRRAHVLKGERDEGRSDEFSKPWQNGVAEKWVGSCRREMLHYVIPLNQQHLVRLGHEYIA
jgi:hypothetical protein